MDELPRSTSSPSTRFEVDIKEAIGKADREFESSLIASSVFAAVISTFSILIYALLALVGLIYYTYLAVSYLPVGDEAFAISHGVFYAVGLIITFPPLVFLLRPLLRIRGRDNDYISIEIGNEAEEKVRMLIQKIGEALGIDDRINVQVSNDVIVDVYYPSITAYREHQLHVTIGLPILATLSYEQLIALIVHEYDRYSHPKIRMSYSLVRASKAWCYRILNNEDAWMLYIESLADRNIVIRLLALPITLGVSVVNKCVWALFVGMNSLITRVSEKSINALSFRADTLQALLLGSQGFRTLQAQLVAVDQSYHATLEKVLSEGKVPKNIATLIAEVYANTPISYNQTIAMSQAESFNSWHMLPSPDLRLDNLSRFTSSYDGSSNNVSLDVGVLTSNTPISEVFDNINDIGERVTAQFYEAQGVDTTQVYNGQQNILKKVGKSADEASGSNASLPIIRLTKEHEVLRKFSSGLFQADIAWEMPEANKFENLSAEKVTPFLNKVILSIRHSLPEFTRYIELLPDSQKQRQQFHFYQWLIKDGSRNRPDIEEIERLKFTLKDFDTKYKNSLTSYRKFYGVRVAAAIALGKEHNAYPRAIALLSMLAKLGILYPAVSDAKVKCRTLEKLIARREEGDRCHDKTIPRLTRMVATVLQKLEPLLIAFPLSVLGSEHKGLDIAAGTLDAKTLKAEHQEHLVIARYMELMHYYEAFNTAISAKLALFVDVIERQQNIESVVTVSLEKANKKASA